MSIKGKVVTFWAPAYIILIKWLSFLQVYNILVNKPSALTII